MAESSALHQELQKWNAFMFFIGTPPGEHTLAEPAEKLGSTAVSSGS